MGLHVPDEQVQTRVSKSAAFLSMCCDSFAWREREREREAMECVQRLEDRNHNKQFYEQRG